MKQCDNGHYYDEARFDSCPYCQESAGVGKTVAAGFVGKTVAAVPGVRRSRWTEAERWGSYKRRSAWTPPWDFWYASQGPTGGRITN